MTIIFISLFNFIIYQNKFVMTGETIHISDRIESKATLHNYVISGNLFSVLFYKLTLDVYKKS